jgi:hypothetical protein
LQGCVVQENSLKISWQNSKERYQTVRILLTLKTVETLERLRLETLGKPKVPKLNPFKIIELNQIIATEMIQGPVVLGIKMPTIQAVGKGSFLPSCS